MLADLADNHHDIQILTETKHTETKKMLHTDSCKEHTLCWGAPHNDHGVAIMFKGNIITEKLTWPAGHPLQAAHDNGRLLAVRSWPARSERPLYIYAVYGPSGAMTEKPKKTWLHNCINAIHQDMIKYGSLPVLIAGDLNIDVASSPQLQHLTVTRQWWDSSLLDPQPEQATSQHGKGNRVDHILLNPAAMEILTSRSTTHYHIADHLSPSVQLRWPTTVMHRTVLIPFAEYEFEVSKVAVANAPILPAAKTDFNQALRHGCLDRAMTLWNQIAEQHLRLAVTSAGGHVIEGKPRGNHKIQQQKVHPTVVGPCAATLLLRRLARMHRQSQECVRLHQGRQREQTWRNLRNQARHLTCDLQADLLPQLDHPCSVERAQALLVALHRQIQTGNAQLQTARLDTWKRKVQESEKNAYRWLKRKRNAPPKPMRDGNGCFIASPTGQLECVRIAWKNLYNIPEHAMDPDQFAAKYLDYITPTDVRPLPLTAEGLHNIIQNLSDSSPGLDGWHPRDLRALCKHSPTVIDLLAELFAAMSNHGTWPKQLHQGLVVTLPKDTDATIQDPMSVRPITITSTLYRVWAKWQLASLSAWYRSWSSNPDARHGPDVVAVRVQLSLESSAYGEIYTGGLSYDLSKAFDRVPQSILWQTMRRRNAPPSLIRLLQSWYANLSRWMRFGDMIAEPYKATNGLVQGCPLSMMLFDSLIEIWRALQTTHGFRPHSYADDLSITHESRVIPDLVAKQRASHRLTKTLLTDLGAIINLDKSFTFGHDKLAGTVDDILHHKVQFRLLGGSMVVGRNTGWTDQESARRDAWREHVQRVRCLPLPWQSKAKVLQATITKLTWGQGMHSRPRNDNALRSDRTCMLRCLWNSMHYTANPDITLSLLVSPALNPEFAADYQALLLLRRLWAIDDIRILLEQRLANRTRNAAEGPTRRLRQLLQHPICGPTARKIIEGTLEAPGKWQHELRETWRRAALQRAAKSRPHHFDGVQNNVDRRATLSLLMDLQAAAQSLHQSIAHGAVPPPLEEDPRPRAKVLRLFLAGGLLTPERYWRHKSKGQETRACACGAPDATPDHIQWHCPRYADARDPLLRLLTDLGLDAQDLPNCLRTAGILPVDFPLDLDALKKYQAYCITIWQRHIHDWHTLNTAADGYLREVTELPQSSPVQEHLDQDEKTGTDNSEEKKSENAYYERNGHVISTYKGALFCRKCGKTTSIASHLKLKITGRPCKQAHQPPEEWVDRPGAHAAQTRLDEQERHMHALNRHGHDLRWNRLCGRDPMNINTYGMIHCLRCMRSWPWHQRHANLPRSLCRQQTHAPSSPMKSTPQKRPTCSQSSLTSRKRPRMTPSDGVG